MTNTVLEKLQETSRTFAKSEGMLITETALSPKELHTETKLLCKMGSVKKVQAHGTNWYFLE